MFQDSLTHRSVEPLLRAHGAWLAVFLLSAMGLACESAEPEAEQATAEPPEAAPELAPDDVGLKFEPVVGGKESGQCGWPSTVDINGCTGTLIHPRVVTTAAHCLSGTSARITFTAGKNMPGSFQVTGTCKTGARGSSGGGTSRDWAYCVLPEDMRVAQMPITPPIIGCEAEKYLKPGAKAWVVGFGTTGPNGQGAGIKREVEVNINKVQNGVLDIGDRNVGACHGDSGGPLYIKLTDGTHDWGLRVAGSTSSASSGNCDCTCSTIYVNIANHVKAIEMNENIDVTPCTDADGKWAPGPDCHDFQRSPEMATGTYPSCTVMKTTEPIDSCSGGAVAPAGGAGGASGGAGGASGRGATAGRGGSGGSAGSSAGGAGGSAGASGMMAAAGGSAGAAAGAAGSGIAGTGASAGFGGVGAAPVGTTSPGTAGRAGNVGTATNGVGVAGAAGATGVGVAGATSFTIPAKNADDGGCSVAAPGSERSASAGWMIAALAMIWIGRRRRRG